MRNDPFWVRLASDSRLLDLAQRFLGPDLALFSSHYFCKMPRVGREVPWHQDAGAVSRICVSMLSIVHAYAALSMYGFISI